MTIIATANAKMAPVQTSRAIPKAWFRVFDLGVLRGLEVEMSTMLDGILIKKTFPEPGSYLY